MHQRWTEEEERYLRKQVEQWPGSTAGLDEFVAKQLNRTVPMIRAKRRRLGLVHIESEAFEPDDDNEYLLDEIVADYVELGGNLTKREIARKYALSVKGVSDLLKAHGITKSSLPFGPNTVLGSEVEDLVDRALRDKERRVAAKIEQAEITRLQKEYRRLLAERHSQDRWVAVAREIGASLPAPLVRLVNPRWGRPGPDWVAHVPTTDEHVGSLVWSEESFGDDYDTDIACERLRRHAELAAEWIAGEPGKCKMVHRTFVGDLLHALLGATENGTALDQDTRAAKVWMELVQALKYSITLLAEYAPVAVDSAEGNHDGKFEFFALMYTLKESFAGDPRVTVNVNPGKFSAFRVGESLHVLDHGTKQGAVGSWKTLAQAGNVARRQGELYKGAERVYTYMGHQHAHESASQGDLEVIRLPALCESNDYETSLRYYNTSAAHCFRLDEDGRIRNTYRFYRDDFEVTE